MKRRKLYGFIYNMRIAALDIAKKQIGLAFSDEEQSFIAFETTLKTKNFNYFLRQLDEYFLYYKPMCTYIGINEEKYGESHEFIQHFSENLSKIIGKYEFLNEDFSTFEAKYMVDEGYIKIFSSVDSIVARSLIYQAISKTKNLF